MTETLRRINRKISLLFVLGCLSTTFTKANTGDTTIVHGFNHFTHQNCNVGDSTFLFPSDTLSFYKIMLRYELSCLPQGCDIYDRIATLKVKKHTGIMDSTFVVARSYSVNGNYPDSLQFMTDTSYSYSYNSNTHSVDSLPMSSLQLILFNDQQNPLIATDTMTVWPAFFNQYLFDSLGVATDSVFVVPDSVIYLSIDTLYTPFEVIEFYEIARAITPYGQGVVLWFDVSDYRMLLHDSVNFESRACGYSNGWVVTTDFYYIEGIPPMHPYSIQNLWNGTFLYGNTSNPIDSHLQPITLHIDSQAVYEKIRLITTGHGFGCSPNQNVAEFYNVTHNININGTNFQQKLWRSDCGRNPLYPQGAPGYTSTWFYKRANWCPGSYVTPHDYNATTQVSGDTLRVDYNMANYTVTNCASGTYPPEYYIQSQAIFYDDIHYNNNAAILEVRKPNGAFEYNRMNPICQGFSPEILIRNYGADTLTQLTVHYGIDGNYSSTFNWTGSLKLTDTATVILPPVSFNHGTHSFDVYIESPNNLNDEFAFDDTMHTSFQATNVFNTDKFVIKLTTDNGPAQIIVKIKNEQDSTIFSRSNYSIVNHVYTDTVFLSNGCYNFKITDNYGDGICCYNGSGNLKLYQGASVVPLINSGDYGEYYALNFTMDLNSGIEENSISQQISVFPNPASNLISLNTSFEFGKITVEIRDLAGRIVSAPLQGEVSEHFCQIALPTLPDGLYYLQISNGKRVFMKKLVIKN